MKKKLIAKIWRERIRKCDGPFCGGHKLPPPNVFLWHKE